MIRSVLKILFILFFTSSFGQELSVSTYNIRLDIASDAENAWPNRKDFLISQLKFYAPDIFGIQEGLPHQVKYIDEQLPEFNFVGEGRDGKNEGEYSAVFYNKNKFLLKESGTFWLSPTPAKVSKGWDAALPRICTYAKLMDIDSGLIFWVFNTHFDHRGEKARLNSSTLILKKIADLNSNNFPVVLMGDFNAEPLSAPISNFKDSMNDSKDVAIEEPFGPDGTFNSFDFSATDNKRIDYIFVSRSANIQVKKYAVLRDYKNSRFPSDHFPVYVKLKMNYNK